VTTDSGVELGTPARSHEVDPHTDGAIAKAVTDSANGVDADPVDAKPAIGVTTDFGVASSIATP
jgi:hypothetical protein